MGTNGMVVAISIIISLSACSSEYGPPSDSRSYRTGQMFPRELLKGMDLSSCHDRSDGIEYPTVRDTEDCYDKLYREKRTKYRSSE